MMTVALNEVIEWSDHGRYWHFSGFRRASIYSIED